MTFASSPLPARLYRVTKYRDPLTFTEWRYLEGKAPGRWDDPLGEYRVLYTAATPVAALVEVLQDLRPRFAAEERILAEIEDEEGLDPHTPYDDMNEAIVERLRDRRIGEILAGDPEQRAARVDAPATRTGLERVFRIKFNFRRLLKIGDFTGKSYRWSMRASRAAYEARDGAYVAIAGPSAEAPGAMCYALFETGHESETPRARLSAGNVFLALDDAVRGDVGAALDMLSRVDAPLP